MANTTRNRMSELLLSHKRYVKYLVALTCVAAGVGLGVFISMRQTGVAKVHEVRVLECPHEGLAAHTHNADCYDEEGNLVCLLEEMELHVHDDSCYTKERTLICGLEESEGHAHTEECYDAEGNLTCGLEESEGHTHTDECYEVTRTLTCGKEEVTEEHVHGPGCFKTILVSDGEEEELEAATESNEEPLLDQFLTGELRTLDADGNEQVTLVASVKAPAGSLPMGATMELAANTALAEDEITAQVEQAVERELGNDITVKEAVVTDITLRDAEGNEVIPSATVDVKLSAALVHPGREIVLVRLCDATDVAEGTQADATLVRDVTLVNWDEADTSTGNESALMFWTSERLGSYAIVEIEEAGEEAAPAEQPAEEAASEPAAAQDPASTEESEPAQEGEPAASTDASASPSTATDAAPAAEQPATTETEAPGVVASTTDPMPAQTFEGRAGDVLVQVKAPQGAFPTGTTMRVKAIAAAEVTDAMTSALPGMYEQVAAVDITFHDAADNEIEPQAPIKVTMTNVQATTTGDGQPVVMRVDDAGEATVVTQSAVSTTSDKVVFDMEAQQ